MEKTDVLLSYTNVLLCGFCGRLRRSDGPDFQSGSDGTPSV